MEFKFSLDEMMELAEIAGSVAGVADIKPSKLFPPNNEKKTLYSASEAIMNMLRKKINALPDSKTIPDDTSRP